jgi:hypothetical protein
MRPAPAAVTMEHEAAGRGAQGYRENAMLLKTLFLAAMLAIGAVSAQAAEGPPLDDTFTIKIFQTASVTLSSPEARAERENPVLGGTPLATVTYVGPLNFNLASGSATIGAFLASGTGTVIGGVPPAVGGLSLFGALGNAATVLDISFTAGPISGGEIDHDDGVSLYLGENTLVSSPLPTSPVSTGFSSGTGGKYRLVYVAGFGLPEVLTVTGTVPPPDAVNFSCRIDLTQVGAPLPTDLQYVLTATTSEKFCPDNNGGVLTLKCSGKFPPPPQPQYTGSLIDSSAGVCQISRAQCGINDEVFANVKSIKINPATQLVELSCEYSPAD